MKRVTAICLVLTGIVAGLLMAMACGVSTSKAASDAGLDAAVATKESCKSWRVKALLLSSDSATLDTKEWEPFGAYTYTLGGAERYVLVRYCNQ